MKRLIAILVSATVIGVLVWGARRWYADGASRATRWRECPVERKAVNRVLTERGWLISLDAAPVLIKATGEITEIAATGDCVKKGDMIVRLDDTDIRERLEDEQFGLYDAEQELAAHKASRDYTREQQDNLLRELRKQLEVARLEEEKARRGLLPEERRQLRVEREIARIDLEDAVDEEARQRRLFDKGFISQAMLDPYVRRVKTRRAALAEIEARIRIEEKGVLPEELMELQKRRERIESELARGEKARERRLEEAQMSIVVSEHHVARHTHEVGLLKEELEATVAVAPRDGIVAVRYTHGHGGWSEYRPGLKRYKNDRLADIVDLGRMKVELMIHESDAERVHIGTKARVTLPAFPGLVLDGEVEEIGGIGRDRADVAPSGYESGHSGITMFNASVSVTAADVDMRPGMSAVVDLLLQPEAAQLVLPRAAVTEEDGTFYVRRRRDADAVRHSVRGRILNSDCFAVEEGLSEGDVVLAPITGSEDDS